MVEAWPMTQENKHVEVYDLRGLNCPLPVLKARKKLREMDQGAQIWVETTDPLAVIDMPHFCVENNHQLVAAEERDGMNRFLIMRGPDA